MRELSPDAARLASHRHLRPSDTISRLFLAQVEHRPDKVAVVEDGRRVTYRQLAGLAAAVARDLARAGVGRGDRVGLLSRRSPEAVAAQLGTLAVGAAFVPLDPAHPAEHRRDVVAEAAPAAILVHPDQASLAAGLAPPGRGVIALAVGDDPEGGRDGAAELGALLADPGRAAGADDLAYVIYTSGSTGRPKGVMVAHRGVCRLVRGQDYADLGPDQVMLHMAAVAFDASIGEVYSAVLNGGTLAVLPDAVPSLDRIAEAIKRDRVTVAYITAGLFHVLAEHRPDALAPLRQAFPCGDVLSEAHVRRVRALHPHLRLVNGYGPTENTVFTCCFTIDDGWQGGPIPIGRGLHHDRLFVLDEENRPLPAGAVGQLAIGGAGVGLGYLGRPDLTAEKFVELSIGDFRGRAYLTGDLALMRPDGVVCFHGRLDRQVKVNGQRVELDAVEHALRADPAVEDAVAVAVRRPDGSRQVVGIVRPAGDAAAARPEALADAVLGRMRATAPAAMVPARLLARGSFPLSGSGKVDRRRLAAEVEAGMAGPDPTAALGLAPSTPEAARATIRDCWVRALGLAAPVGAPDEGRTFFELGGTSLQLIALHALLQDRLGRAINVASLFEAPRLRDLERLLAAPGAGRDGGPPDPLAERRAAAARARARKVAPA